MDACMQRHFGSAWQKSKAHCHCGSKGCLECSGEMRNHAVDNSAERARSHLFDRGSVLGFVSPAVPNEILQPLGAIRWHWFSVLWLRHHHRLRDHRRFLAAATHHLPHYEPEGVDVVRSGVLVFLVAKLLRGDEPPVLKPLLHRSCLLIEPTTSACARTHSTHTHACAWWIENMTCIQFMFPVFVASVMFVCLCFHCP